MKNPGRGFCRGCGSWIGLALAELEALTGTRLAVFLTFLHTRIASEVSAGLQGWAEGGVDFEQGAGDAVAHGAGLAGGASTGHDDAEVELRFIGGDGEGFDGLHAQLFEREVGFEGAAIDRDFAGAWGHTDAGDGGFAPACAEEVRGFSHS